MELNITNVGQDTILHAMNGGSVEFTRVLFGNGANAGLDATALSNPQLAAGIQSLTHDDGADTATVTAVATNANVTAPFKVTEIGLLAIDPTDREGGGEILFAYGYTPEDEAGAIPAGDDYAMEIAENLIIYVGRAENVSAVIAESQIYATRAALEGHINDTNNPHQTDKNAVGLGNVPNVTTNDQTPTYTESSSLTALSSGEKLSAAMGKIAKAVKALIAHIADTANPHKLEPVTIGAAAASHTHRATDITSGVLGIGNGGTGGGTAAAARTALGAVAKTGDTMTGNLTLQKTLPAIELRNTDTNRSVIIQAESGGGLNLWNSVTGNMANQTNLFILRPETAPLANAVQLERRKDGTNERYNLFGQHNPELLAAAIQNLLQEGSITMIKSVQRGSVAPGLDKSGTITIAAVNTGKAVAILGGTVDGMGGPVQIELTNSTTVTWERSRIYGATGSTNMSGFSWQIVEYY